MRNSKPTTLRDLFPMMAFVTTFYVGWSNGYMLEVSFLWLAVVLIGLAQMVISGIWGKKA